MLKNRIAYVLFIILFIILAFLFNKPFLIYIALLMIAFALVMLVLLHIDKRNIRIKVNVVKSGQIGKKLPVRIIIETNGFRIFCAKTVIADVEIHNIMLGKTDKRRMIFELKSSQSKFDYESEVSQYGRIKISCNTVSITDMLGLFSVKTAQFKSPELLIYPENIDMNIILSKDTIGATKDEGFMQNRKGNDASEMYDIREYVPGDDIRSIHWKLSGKMDNLILRQASEPTHYHALLMPDFAFNELHEITSIKEINKAAAICFEMGRKLLENSVVFCLAVPQKRGLYISEVANEADLQNSITEWMSMRLPDEDGCGLKYFLMEHLEKKFTRLIIVSAGRYIQDLSILNGQIGVLSISAVEDINEIHSHINGTCEMVEIPAEDNIDENYQIVC